MSFIEFDYGSALLPEVGIKKIGALSKALHERPNLKLEIEAYVDPAQDKEALRKGELTRLIKTHKLKEMVGGRSVTNNIVVNAAPGMDVRELADAVAERIAFTTEQKMAVFA